MSSFKDDVVKIKDSLKGIRAINETKLEYKSATMHNQT